MVQELTLNNLCAELIILSGFTFPSGMLFIKIRVPYLKLNHFLRFWSFFLISLHSNSDISILVEMMNSVGLLVDVLKAFEAKHAWVLISCWIFGDPCINIFLYSSLP